MHESSRIASVIINLDKPAKLESSLTDEKENGLRIVFLEGMWFSNPVAEKVQAV